MRTIIASLLVILSATSGHAQERLPIIDMHLHAYPVVQVGDQGLPNPVTGRPALSASDAALLRNTLAEMKKHGIILGVASGAPSHVERWRLAAPDRILAAIKVDEVALFPDIAELRASILKGQVSMIGEIQAQHLGLAPDDAALEPYYALAAELDVPVSIHSGIGAPNTPFECCPEFRASLGKPLLLEPVLIAYPGLRVNLMHAGYPFLDQTIGLMTVYPRVYADLGAINWVLPRAEFHRYLNALITAGLGKRLMFGSDQMYWPEVIERAIEGVNSASFLSNDQKRDILYHNAARFLRLSEEEIARHHGK